MLLSELADRAKIDVYPHVLDAWADLDIPVSDGLVAQGDVMFIPMALAAENGVVVPVEWEPVTKEVPLVEGVHAHVLVAGPGACRIARRVSDSEALTIAVLDVAEPVHVLHAEHGAVALAPGKWAVRRTRDQADLVRMVED
jgi:hypothetical protein